MYWLLISICMLPILPLLLLQVKYVEDSQNCSFENMVYRETLKGGVEQPLALSVHNGRVALKSSNKGFVKFTFQEVVAMPSVGDALQENYLDLLMKIVEAGKGSDKKKDSDKKRIWLYLLCQDVYLTTTQVCACTVHVLCILVCVLFI